METPNKCVHCEERERKDKEQEQASLAILLSMVPLVVLAFFGQIGLL